MQHHKASISMLAMCLVASLAPPASGSTILLERRFPGNVTSLPLLARPFVQRGTGSSRALVCLENGTVELLYYFQGEYVLKGGSLARGIVDMIEVYRDRDDLPSNHFLVSAPEGVGLYTFGADLLREIAFVPCRGGLRFVAGGGGTGDSGRPVDGGRPVIVAFDGCGVDVIRLTDGLPGIGGIDVLYRCGEGDIVSVLSIPGSRRLLILRKGRLVALDGSGGIGTDEPLPVPVSNLHDAASLFPVDMADLAPEAAGIWNGYRQPACVHEAAGETHLVYACEGGTALCEIADGALESPAVIPFADPVCALCPRDSTVLIAGGGHTGRHYRGFVAEYTYGGEPVGERSLAYPVVFIAPMTGGYALHGFANQLIFFDGLMRIRAVDHSAVFPTFCEAMRLDEDGTTDLLVGGVSGLVSLPDTLVDRTAVTLGEQEKFRFLERAEDRYTGRYYRLDGFINNHSRIAMASEDSLRGAMQVGVRGDGGRAAERMILAAREGFFRVGDDAGVEACDAALVRLARAVADRRWFPPLLVAGCLLGSVAGAATVRKRPGVLGLLVFAAYAVLLFRVLQRGSAVNALLVSCLFLLGASFAGLRLGRRQAGIPVAGPSPDSFRGFLMALGAFDHSGRATRIIESLGLLLRSRPEDPGEVPGYGERLRELVGVFLDTVIPQIREIVDLLRSILPRGGSSGIERIRAEIEGGLCVLAKEPFPGAAEVEKTTAGIDRLDGYMRALRHFVRDYPGTPVREVVEEVIGAKRDVISELGVELRYEPRLDRAEIARLARHELEAVCENLLSNALRALALVEERAIRVELFEEEGLVVVAFSDSGPGVPAESAGDIFADKGKIEKGGFGLPYSRFVLEKAGGSIGLGKSVLGGATFVVRLVPWHHVMRAYMEGKLSGVGSNDPDVEDGLKSKDAAT